MSPGVKHLRARAGLVSALVLMLLTACVGVTAGQRYHEATLKYQAAQAGAIAWAISPEGQKHPEAIRRIVQVDAGVIAVVADVNRTIAEGGDVDFKIRVAHAALMSAVLQLASIKLEAEPE